MENFPEADDRAGSRAFDRAGSEASGQPTISEAEHEVMKIIWAHAPISTNEVVESLESTSQWSPKTIQTLLSRLVKKGVLRYRKSGRVFVYMPAIGEREYLERESSSFLNRFYNGALNAMVVNFLEQDKLSREELSDLKRMLDERLTEGER